MIISLKYGGSAMIESLLLMINEVFMNESVPIEWSMGMIYPIHKSGDKVNPDNYRGITLLSVVGKLYCTILNQRLMSWCELNGILVKEQGGFRKHRGTTELLYILNDVIRNRQHQKNPNNRRVFAAFIDIRKAYDRIWRDGLWLNMHQVGIQGKLWRIIKNLYQSVQSKVLLNNSHTDWFNIGVGVRQGCVLSPLLFNLFINHLAEEIIKLKVGLKLNNTELGSDSDSDPDPAVSISILLYADDIVLLADTAEDLQLMLDKLYDHSYKWRYTVNINKSAVLIFNPNPRDQTKYEFKLNNLVIPLQSEYKYLGIEMLTKLNWKPARKRLIRGARANMIRALAMGANVGELSIKAGINIYKSLVRSILEYGAEVIGGSGDSEWNEAELIQQQYCKRILNIRNTTMRDTVLTELGLMKLSSRRDLLRLRFWHKLATEYMNNNKINNTNQKSLAGIVYGYSYNEFNRMNSLLNNSKCLNWCQYTNQLLIKLGLRHYWDNNSVTELTAIQWNTIINSAIESYETHFKFNHIQQSEQSKRVYRVLKPNPASLMTNKPEPYLARSEPSPKLRLGRKELTRLRLNSHRLAIETSKWNRISADDNIGVPINTDSEAICKHCNSDQIEDEYHYLFECEVYSDYRIKFYSALNRLDSESIDLANCNDHIVKLNQLLGSGFESLNDSAQCSVKSYLADCAIKRNELQKLLKANSNLKLDKYKLYRQSENYL